MIQTTAARQTPKDAPCGPPRTQGRTVRTAIKKSFPTPGLGVANAHSRDRYCCASKPDSDSAHAIGETLRDYVDGYEMTSQVVKHCCNTEEEASAAVIACFCLACLRTAIVTICLVSRKCVLWTNSLKWMVLNDETRNINNAYCHYTQLTH